MSNCDMWAGMLTALMLVSPFAAAIEPEPEHYAIAYDSLAVAEAARRIVAADEEAKRRAKALDLLRRIVEADRNARNLVVDLWAQEVQRRAGIRGAPRPGTGWHEVKRLPRPGTGWVHRHGE